MKIRAANIASSVESIFKKVTSLKIITSSSEVALPDSEGTLGTVKYCHLVVEQVGGSHHRSPESPCGTLRMLHAVMQATPAAVAGQGAHLPHEAMLVYVGMCHAKYGGWNVRVRAAQV